MHHASILYTDGSIGKLPGLYLIDNLSTHGTKINQYRIEPNKPIKLNPGYVLKFGLSLEFIIVNGPEDEQNRELEISYSKMRQILKSKSNPNIQVEDKNSKECSVSWGIDNLDTSLFVDSTIPTNNVISEKLFAFYSKNPIETIETFFEFKLNSSPKYEINQVKPDLYTCQLNFSSAQDSSKALEVKISQSTNTDIKKQCALRACEILDKKQLLTEDLFFMDMIEENKISDDNQSDSDEDEYLDRSGAAASKRSQRILKRGFDSKTNDSIITFESILSDLKETISKIETIKSQLKHEQKISNKNNEETQLDSLEAYMNAIKQGSMTIKEKQSLKYQLNELEIIKTKTIKYLHQLKPFTMDEDEFKKILDNAEKISHSEKFCSSSPTSGDRLREENISFESLKPVEVQAFCEQNEEEDSSAKLTKNEEVLAKKVKLHSETVKNISELPVHNDSTEEFQEKISTWEPPTDQTGDGETYLNKKFGY